MHINSTDTERLESSESLAGDNERLGALAAALGNGWDAQGQAIVSTALLAGRRIAQDFGRVGRARLKADGSHVTRTDTQVDTLIRKRLQQSGAFEEVSWLAEESAFESKAGRQCLIVDPIDGTTNFVLGLPFFAVSIGLFLDGKPELGVVLNPMTQELYVARAGHGSFLAHGRNARALRRLQVKYTMRRARHESLRRGMHAYCHGGSPQGLARMVNIFRRMKPFNPKYRQFGCASLELCLLAAGALNSFNMAGVNLWDVSAGAIVAQEAGATLSDFEGREFDEHSTDLLASDAALHPVLLKFIQQALREPGSVQEGHLPG